MNAGQKNKTVSKNKPQAAMERLLSEIGAFTVGGYLKLLIEIFLTAFSI